MADQSGPARPPWHHTAIIYEVYLRSFADGNGDGVGDLAGLRSRLPYLRELGVDALWITPWYVSPMADGGYDVADYRDIDPVFGTLEEAEALIKDAHSTELKIIIDIVPNHCSDQHPWFSAALEAGPGSPERARFWFRPGRGADGEEPPNDWPSMFGGPAWTRVTEPDGRPGEWYLHLYAAEQPDLNWGNQEILAEFEAILRFWLDRGVDGFRIDVADFLVKDPALPDVAGLPPGARRPWEDQDDLHEIYRGWRGVVESYPRAAVFVGEIWLKPLTRLRAFLAGDQLHTAFNFDYLGTPWDAASLREVIDTTLTSIGASAPWVLSNHDVTRHVTRYGRADTSHSWQADPGIPDLALGTRRARAAILLSLALPGSAYLYQGEELGLWEVEDIPDELIADPIFARTDHFVRGRDGCRVPLPWLAAEPGFGFGPPHGAQPWLPQPAAWRAVAADMQAGDPGSMLELYRTALALRRADGELADDTLTWLDAQPGVLAFSRPGGLLCVVNISG
ncbi:MAG TPA: glycoside hydrolase family 13 protein, partial [Streptosporangiaceae bacterium]|nr:glycoside hydrolase family 13 protein [Streptosporangiaceae bacterium]